MNKITGGKPGPGRPKGSPNKVTAAAKDIIAQAAEMLGGVDRLVKWAKEAPENERAYWAQIFPKLLPLQVAGDPNNPLHHVVTRIELVAPKPRSEHFSAYATQSAIDAIGAGLSGASE